MKRRPFPAMSADDAVAGVRSFAAAVHASPELQARLSNARAWYAVRDDHGHWAFAPSKWAGFPRMNPAQYLDANDGIDGRQTEKRLSQWFDLLPLGSREHIELLLELSAFASRYGKQPSSACRINIRKEGDEIGTDADDLVDLIVRVVNRLDARQRSRVLNELAD